LPPKKGVKATLHKVFILDAQGGYAGEYAPDPECLAEYSEFLAVLPEGGLGDGKSLYMGEWRATAINGDRMSLIALSKGPLGTEELTWARAALVAAEAQLTQVDTDEHPAPPPTGPDKGVMESLSRAITEREEQLASREAAIREMQERTKTAVEEFRQEKEGEIADLRAQLEAARSQHEADVKALGAEREALRAELDQIAKTTRPPTIAAAPASDPRIEAMRKQNEQDRKHLQKYALELIAREEAVRDREMKTEEEGAKLSATRGELEAMRIAIQEAKSRGPSPQEEAAKRELELRVKILEQKSLDLLQREEKLQAREKKLYDMLKQIQA
jgi:chromosome segregation ATPase